MGYIRAEEILPLEIIELIQKYVDGTNLYIPRKEDNRAGWGQMNHAKQQMRERDLRIYEAYLQGEKMSALAQKYYLSEKSIQRIVSNMRKNTKG